MTDRKPDAGASSSALPPGLTAATLLAASTLTVMAPTIVAPALPSIAREFAATPNADLLVPLVLTLPALVIAFTASLAGFAVDRIGRRPVLLAGILLYGLAGGTGMIATGLTTMLLGRVGLGLAVAAALTAVTTIIADLYRGTDRSRMLSRQAATMGASGTLFTILSGVLAGIDWRWSFLLYPLAWLLVPLVHRAVPESRPQTAAPLDARPQPPVTDREQRRSTVVPGPGTVSDAGRVTAFHPSDVMRPTSQRAVAVVTSSIALLVVVQLVFYLFPVQLPFVLEETFGLPPAVMGVFVAIPPLAYAVSSLTSTRVANGRRRATVVAISFTVTGVGFLAVGTTGSLAVLALGLVIGGVGLGLLVPNLVGWVALAAPARLRGRLMGVMTSALFLGQFLSPVLWSPVVRASGRQAALTAAAVALLALAAAALLIDVLRRRRDRRGWSGVAPRG